MVSEVEVASPIVTEAPPPTDTEQAEPGIAEGVDAESPKGDGQVEPEGTKDPLAELAASFTPEQVRAFKEALPKELQDEVFGEDLRRAEQRGRTRSEEVDTAEASRDQAYDTLIGYGEAADAALNDRVTGITKALKEFDYEKVEKLANPSELATLMLNLRAGGIAEAGKTSDGDIKAMRQKYAPDLKDLPPDVEKQLEQAHRASAINGRHVIEAQMIMEIVAQKRAQKAEETGVTKGKTSIDPALVEKIEKFQKAAAPKVAPNGGTKSPDSSKEARLLRLSQGGQNGVPVATEDDKRWHRDYIKDF